MKKRILAFLAVLIILVSVFPLSIFATESETPLEETIETDLSKSKIEQDFEKTFCGAFDIEEYRPDPTKSNLEIIALTEYENAQGETEVYIYVHNPLQRRFYIREPNTNMITLSYEENSALFNNYQKYELERIDGLHYSVYTPTETNASLLKFRIKGLTISKEAKQKAYSISEIEFQLKNGIVDYSIGANFIFTLQDDGSYEVMSNSSDVIVINKLGHTFYSVQTSDPDYTDDVRMVYFAVDKNLVNKYGVMDAIKVNWQELGLKPILLLDDPAIAREFKSILGRNQLGDFKYSFGTDIRPGNLLIPVLGLGHYGTDFEYGFNVSKFPRKFYAGTDMFNGKLVENTLWAEHYHNLAFDIDDWFDGKVFEGVIDRLYFAEYKEYGEKLIGEEILDMADRYDGKLDGSYSIEVLSSIKNNKNVEFTVRDTGTLGQYEINTSYWNYLLNWYQYDTDYINEVSFNRFEEFNRYNLNYSDEILSSKYCINIDDVQEFRRFAEANKDCNIYFLKYSITKTKTTEASVFGDDTVKRLFQEVKCYECNGSLVETTIINDFDIIQLEFDKEGQYTIVPVSSSPTDAAVDVTHKVRNIPKEKIDWVEIIKILISVIIMAIITVIVIIVALIVFIITLIFKKRGVKNEKKNN